MLQSLTFQNTLLKSTRLMKEMSLFMDLKLNSVEVDHQGSPSFMIINSKMGIKFMIIYRYLLKYEPKFRLRRREILPKRASNRKAWKELKTKIRKSRGKERSKLYVSRKTDKVEEIRKLK